MKLGQLNLTRGLKRLKKKQTNKKTKDDAMSADYDAIVIFHFTWSNLEAGF